MKNINLWQHIQRFTNVFFTAIPGNYKQRLRAILRHAYQVTNNHLQQLNIDYWLDYGTLLGYYREKDILAFDLDIDFGIPECFYSKIWESRHSLPKGFVMYDSSYRHRGPKLYIQYKGFKIDLYFYEDKNEMLANYEITKYPCEVKPLSKEITFPLKKVAFLEASTLVPNQPKAYLEHYYGYIGADAVRDKSTGYWRKKL
ncbi:LicD family protein [Reichenbachiella sp. MALMAid0571]|uniref:LicD family protein n=1 Tax=Reichenbachiella sp. MALMAid0571 TaxID=3143939 RepID=UPI0032E024C2